MKKLELYKPNPKAVRYVNDLTDLEIQRVGFVIDNEKFIIVGDEILDNKGQLDQSPTIDDLVEDFSNLSEVFLFDDFSESLRWLAGDTIKC